MHYALYIASKMRDILELSMTGIIIYVMGHTFGEWLAIGGSLMYIAYIAPKIKREISRNYDNNPWKYIKDFFDFRKNDYK